MMTESHIPVDFCQPVSILRFNGFLLFFGNWIKFEMGGIVTLTGQPRATLSAGKAGISTRVNILLSGRVLVVLLIFFLNEIQICTTVRCKNRDDDAVFRLGWVFL